MCAPTENMDVEASAGDDITSQQEPSSRPSPPSRPPPPPLQLPPPQVQEPLSYNCQYNGPEISSDLNKNIDEDPSSSLPHF